MSIATAPSQWVYDDDGAYDPEATCRHCGSTHGQVLGGARHAVRCRCTNNVCERTFIHTLWPLR